MNGIDAKVFVLIAVATTAVIGGLKKAFPTYIKGKEELIAVAIPVLFTIVGKIAGLFSETNWVDALIFAFGSGVGSGLIHDYAVNPLIKGKKTDE